MTTRHTNPAPASRSGRFSDLAAAAAALLAGLWPALQRRQGVSTGPAGGDRLQAGGGREGPPDLDELLRVQQDAAATTASSEAAEEELRKVLLGSFYAGYVALLRGNARSARYRTRSLRLVLLALACVAVAFLLLPLHLAGVAP